VAPLVSCLRCFFGELLLMYLFLSFIFFARWLPHDFVSVWLCSFVYKSGQKPVLR
jgi:hypothetical protein